MRGELSLYSPSLEHLLSPWRPDRLNRAALTPEIGNQTKVSSLLEEAGPGSQSLSPGS